MLRFSRPACRKVQRALWDYANHRLSEGLMEIVERHLPDCSACRKELDSLRRAQCLLTAYRQETPPAPRTDWEDLRARLIEAGHFAPQSAYQPDPPVALLTAPKRERKRPTSGTGGGWLPSLMWSGGFAMLLLSAALSYHVFQAVTIPSGQRVIIERPNALNTAASNSVHKSHEPTESARAAAYDENQIQYVPVPVVDLGAYSPYAGAQNAAGESETSSAASRTAEARSSAGQERQASGRWHFQPHHPRREEATRLANTPRPAPMDQIVPGNATGEATHHFIMEPLTPVSYDDHTAY